MIAIIIAGIGSLVFLECGLITSDEATLNFYFLSILLTLLRIHKAVKDKS